MPESEQPLPVASASSQRRTWKRRAEAAVPGLWAAAAACSELVVAAVV